MSANSFATDEQRFGPVTPAAGSAEDCVRRIAETATLVADCPDLDARDRNAAIGQLRAVACMLRGAPGLPGFKQAPFAQTTPTSPKPTL